MGDSLILEQSMALGQNFSSSLKDMLGVESMLMNESLTFGRFHPKGRMTAIIHFTGVISGEYAVSLEEETAAKLLGISQGEAKPNGVGKDRTEYAGFLKEALNTTVGSCIPKLEEQFDSLAFNPPWVVYGQLESPEVPSGRIGLETPAGHIECHFALDLAGLDLGRKLRKVVNDLEELRASSGRIQRDYVRMTRRFRGAVLSITPEGRIRSAEGRDITYLFQLAPNFDMVGQSFLNWMPKDQALRTAIVVWFRGLADRVANRGIDDGATGCPIDAMDLPCGKRGSLSWSALEGEGGKFDGLVLVVSPTS